MKSLQGMVLVALVLVVKGTMANGGSPTMMNGTDGVMNGTDGGMILPLPLHLQGNPSPGCDNLPTPGFDCPEGWSSEQDGDGVVCLWLSEEKTDMQSANTTCQEMGSHLVSIKSQARQNTITRFVEKVDGGIWTAAVKRRYADGFLWDGMYPLNFTNGVKLGYDSRQMCIYLSSLAKRDWRANYGCNSYFSYVCTIEPPCLSTRVGQHCESECHCLGEPCQGEQPCSSGCQMGWSGPQCCWRKDEAEVIPYCINTGAERYLELRVDTRNTDYALLQPVDQGGGARHWCSDLSMSLDPQTYSYTIHVPVQDDGDTWNDTCGREKTGNNKFQWRLALQEKDGLQLPLDTTYVITCDFDDAETLSLSQKYDIQPDSEREGLSRMEILAPMREDVSLDVVDPYSGDVIRQGVLGATVALRVSLNVTGGMSAQGVSPFDCVATTRDGELTRALTSSSGCPVSPAVVSSLSGTGGTVTSEPFQLFRFPGHHVVSLTCRFTFCFTPAQQPKCDDRCAHEQSEKRRRRKRATEDKAETVSTRIRILPDVNSRAADVPAPNSGHVDSTNMMTPVAWFLAVIVLVVSAALVYVIYFRATKRSVPITDLY